IHRTSRWSVRRGRGRGSPSPRYPPNAPLAAESEVRLAAGDQTTDIQDLHRLSHSDEFVFEFFGDRLHTMIQALLDRTGGRHGRGTGDAVLVDNALYRFQ